MFRQALPRTFRWAHGFIAISWLVGVDFVAAQDVVVSPIAWVERDDPPDELPMWKQKLRPDFPNELRKTNDLGWATLEITLNDDGKPVGRLIYGTQPAYARAVELAYIGLTRVKPGRRSGRPVNTRIRITAAFNPAAAGEKLADAAPRLLDATVVRDPRRKAMPAIDPDMAETVWGKVKVDIDGNATLTASDRPELQELLQSALPQWKFSPARKSGQRIEAEIVVPFIVLAPEEQPPGDRVPPKATHIEPPVYPVGLHQSGLRGEVVIDFVVDIEGRVRNPIVVRTLNPAFNWPAINALKRWRFQPGRVGDVPVNVLIRQTISFALDDEPDGGDDGIDVYRKGDMSKLPPELRYDTPPKMDTLVQPRYPYPMLSKRTSGSAVVRILVDAHGKVVGTKIATASHPEFGFALQAAVQLFKYRPAIKDGQPGPALIGFKYDFDPSDPTLITPQEFDALSLERKHPERILKATDLDTPLKPGVPRTPLFPLGVPAGVDSGEAMVEFLIDHEGRVCLPRVKSASRPEFGYAAVQAVAEWRFDPPTSGGKPGAVRVSVPFAFKRPPLPAPASPPSS